MWMSVKAATGANTDARTWPEGTGAAVLRGTHSTTSGTSVSMRMNVPTLTAVALHLATTRLAASSVPVRRVTHSMNLAAAVKM